MTIQQIADSFAEDFEQTLGRAEQQSWFALERAGRVDPGSEADKGLGALRAMLPTALAVSPKLMTPLWFRYAAQQLPQKSTLPQDILDVLTENPDLVESIPRDLIYRVIGSGVVFLRLSAHA